MISRLALLTGCCLLVLTQISASAPSPVTAVAPFNLIEFDLDAKLKKLQELLKAADKFEEQKDQVARTGSVIACLAQAAVEHEGSKAAKFHAPALRDAGLAVRDASSHEEAAEALKLAESAWKGETEGEHEKEHAWDDLISMTDLMIEMDERNGGISRSMRRTRGRVEEQANASTNAILALAMQVDHNYLSEDDDEEKWNQHSQDYREAMTAMIKAIGDKDQKQIVEFYRNANRACDLCHESFR